MSSNQHLARRRASLSAEQQALLQQRLSGNGETKPNTATILRGSVNSAPLSLTQQGQWFLWQMEPANTAYHVGGGLSLDGVLDVAALQKALHALIQRHESLRTVFCADAEGQLEQVIDMAAIFYMPCVDLSVIDDVLREQRWREETRAISATPFDLEAGPLFRVRLLKLAHHQHQLLLMMHHIISDAWSVDILLTELAQLYAAERHGLPTKLPQPEVRYADFAAWQQRWLQGEEATRQLAYWQARLGDNHPVLELPIDYPRGSRPSMNAAQCGVELPATLVTSLKAQSRQQGATLFMTLLAGLHALLFRYTGQSEIRTGVPVANRNLPEVAGVVGVFINTVIIKNDIDVRGTFTDLLAQTRDVAIAAQQHQDLPLERIAETCRAQGSAAGASLFQVLFNHLQPNEDAFARWPDLQVAAIDFAERKAPFELTVETIEQTSGGIVANFRYAAELFDEPTIKRMAEHYLALLHAITKNPQQVLEDIDFHDTDARAQLKMWSTGKTRYSYGESLHELFEAHALLQPAATALIFNDDSLSYGELNARANQLAHRLIGLGVTRESRVGVAVERGFDMIIGVLAILKAGAAYVPLDPDYPPQRLQHMIDDSGIGLLLTQQHVQAHLSPLLQSLPQLEIVLLDTIDLTAESNSNPQVAIHGNNLAYVIYTSGSTGAPKGAQLCHHNVTRLFAATQQWFHFDSSDVWTLFHSYAFDFSVWEIFGALCHGGKLAIVPFLVSRSPNDFLVLLRRHQVTVLNQTPSAFEQLIYAQSLDAAAFALRYVIFGGEALEPRKLQPWLDRFGDQQPQLINMFGITETTVHVTCRRITRADLDQSRSPVGVAIDDLGIWVVDAALQPVSVGVAGDLYVAGDGLCRGYLNRAALTAERFIANPFASDGGRLYRTGDRARWNAQGELEYLGRADQQVKIRGFRIELGEIESRLQMQAGIRGAVVVARDGAQGTLLVAYVSAEAGTDIDTTIVKQQLATTLPDYMVPTAIVMLSQLPLNANGKVDRKALPEPQFGADRIYEAPEGDVELTLASIWSDVLGVARVGRNENFFELGGHSLLAIRLLEYMRRSGFPADVRTLFRYPCLADFAAELTQQTRVLRNHVVVPSNRIPAACQSIQPDMVTLIALDGESIRQLQAAIPGGAVNIQDIYPLAPLQEGILFHHLLQSAGDAYVTPALLGFDSRARLERFVDSLNQVIARHDILRTAVLWEGLPEPVQVVQRQASVQLQWLDTDACSDDVAADLDRYVHHSHFRIDVRQAPMLRAIAAQDPVQQRWLLQLPSHHLMIDHTTLEMLVNEIALIQQGRHAELPAPMPFRNFVAQARLGVSRDEHEAFFRAMLSEVDTPTTAFDLLDVQGDGTNVCEAVLPLAPALSKRIREQARKHGISAATLFHLAWAMVLGRASGSDDVVFGTVLFGRMQGGEGAERAFGMFINTLPLRVQLDAPVQQCLQRTHALLIDLLHHEHASLTLAQRCAALPGGTPLFSALFNYRHGNAAPARNTWKGMEVIAGRERTNYPLDMSVDDLGEDFTLVAQVDIRVDANRVCGYLRNAVQSLVHALETNSVSYPRDFDLLDKEEHIQLKSWSSSDTRYPSTVPVHELFEQQVQRQPNAIALRFDDEVLSYQQLNAQANQLAHYLIRQGVGADINVGLALERSVSMVVALLAVLKAGAAYVPLDPEYPPQRLQHMIEDSGIALLLTHSAVQQRLDELPAGLAVRTLDTLALQNESTHSPAVSVHPQQLAYVIYTSGSTGLPKGVGIAHHALAEHAQVSVDFFALTAADRMLQFSTFNFDAFIEQLFPPLITGASIVLRGPTLWDSDQFYRELLAQKITVADLTTAYWQVLVQDFVRRGLTDYGVLRQVHAGGEALPPEAINTWRAAGLSHVTLLNTYGPTEATVTATTLDCAPYVTGEQSLPLQMPIGKPLAGRCVHVLDANLSPVPQGVAGELYIGGDLLARGYLNRVALTAERFVADPFSSNGNRLYRTGDRVRWNAEGQLDYLGRTDHQIKIRGFRVEPGEIEAQLLAQPNVREALVLALDAPGGARLVAYVVTQTEMDTTALCQQLAANLPDYLVPAAIVALPQFPLTPNGKVDRAALPAPQFGSEQNYEAPEGEVEQALAQLWAEVLGVETVGRYDNFFELGGHSLLCVQLVSRINSQLQVAIGVREIFQYPQLVEQAILIAAAKDSTQIDAALLSIDSFIDELEMA